MSDYRPIGYCTICRGPVFRLTALSQPCGARRFGRICHGEIVSALDLKAWDKCPCQIDNTLDSPRTCNHCNGSGWVPHENPRAENIPCSRA